MRYAVAYLVFFAAAVPSTAEIALIPPPQILLPEKSRCEAFYPYDEIVAGIEGRTKLEFTVTAFGRVEDVTVVDSSGNAHLDDAAKRCVKPWHYQPAKNEQGEAVAVKETFTVVWALPHPPAFAEPPRDCIASAKLGLSDLDGKFGKTEVRFSIVNGLVRDATVVAFSGIEALDRMAVDCVKTRRFVAAAGGSTPAQFRERIDWGDGLPPVPGTIVRPRSVGPLHICTAEYPPLALRLGEQGNARVGFTVGKDGKLKDFYIKQSSGSDNLDRASIDCIAGWRYWPVTIDGKITEVPWQASVQWRLR